MPWMRVAMGVGGSAMVVGVAGMFIWIHDDSHYFDLAVAVAMAGLLTLVACVLTKVFGSSHGSQDDAFRRGMSMGYDAGFLEGHRTARPVVVPMHAVDRDLEVPVSDIADAAESRTPPPTVQVWHGDAWDRDAWELVATGDRMAAWTRARRIPILAGALSLTLVLLLAATALARTPMPPEAFQQSPGTPFSRAVPPSQMTPALVAKLESAHVKAPVAAIAEVSFLVPAVAGVSSIVPALAAGVVAAPIAVSHSLPRRLTLPAVASPVDQPAVALPASTPTVGPVVVAPVVPLTVAEQTAANAAAAAKLTAANAAAAVKLTATNAAAAAKLTATNAAAAATLTATNAAAAAKLTAANAKAAAAETARVAAAAAEATRLQAVADAYAVAHPGI